MEIQAHHKKHFALGLITVGVMLLAISGYFLYQTLKPVENRWKFESIDTMKYSRDLSREKMNDETFDKIINQQIELIAKTGATHVGIATPYDDEFLPMLRRWVKSARANKLKVWFRGNFSGWEGWFEYPKITREEHLVKTRQFIEKNGELFEDGDVFTPCPECENGGPGDPRFTGDIDGHRAFLIAEYKAANEEFERINKSVVTNYSSMNFDVAKLIMDRRTTREMGGVVTIDHYVKNPEKLSEDATYIAILSGGKVVLGEFGAPIPDIHGQLSEVEQAEWLRKALDSLDTNTHVIGLNYWVGTGGSTQLWDGNGVARAAVEEITTFYKSVSGK